MNLIRRAGLALAASLLPFGALADNINPPSAVYYCASCHGMPLGSGGTFISTFGSTTNIQSDANLRSWLTGLNATMAVQANLANLSDTDLAAIRPFIWQTRNADVQLNNSSGALNALSRSYAFPTSVYSNEQSVETLTVKVLNHRLDTATVTPSLSGAGSTWFQITANTCGGGLAAASAVNATTLSAPSCSISVKFAPPSGASAGASPATTLNVAVNWGAGGQSPTSVTHPVSLSGTGLGPRVPNYNPIGFAALTTFTAATNASQTICRTISNAAGSASLSLAFGIAQSGGTDYTGYYELDTLAACPGGSPPLCAAAAGSVTGGTSVAAGDACTLAVKFNPGKFGFAGGTGLRPATLRVTHNDPTAGTLSTHALNGNATTGPQPQIGISTNPAPSGGVVSPPAFASQIVGTTSALWNDFLVSNTGTADGLDITAVNLGNAAEFSLSENCVAAAPLARLVGSSPTCTIGLTFTPLAAPAGLGQRCTTVTIQAAFSSNGDQVVTVCGTGVPVPVPQMDVSRTAIAFGNRAIGAIYLPEMLTITNRASATLALQIGAVGISGNGFAFVPDASSCQNKSLAAGTSCTLQVQFTPDPNVPDTVYNASLTLASNDPTTPNLVVPLSATARAAAVPVLQWPGGTSSLSFPGLVIAGQQSASALTVRLSNAGPGAADVQAVRVVGADASSFSITSCPALLYEGQFCDVSLRFLPGSGGTKTAQVEVVSANGLVPAPLTVQGQGVGGSSPFLTVSSDVLTFGGVRVGARSEPLELRLAAGGDGVLRVTAITADAPFSVVSQTCPPLPFTLPLGSECRISVSFEPSSVSTASGKLSIATDSGARPVEVELDGVGQQQADVSGGGCALASDDPRTDPTLWLLVLAAAGVLWRRSAHRRNERNR